ncbi:hypothetical protein [Kordia sp.]|uniref:hypothetical protein n=1 Tax=Kordia sp. TaxID=1965332 RepID=UPI003B58C134
MALKYLHVNERHYKKQLLVSNQQVKTLKNFLTGLIRNEVLIINTNLGLEIYYEADYDCTPIIKDAIAIVVCKKCDANDLFRFISFQNEKEIQHFMDDSIAQVSEMPLFQNYTKSMLHQLKTQFESNKQLIGKLSDIWFEVTRNLRFKNVSIEKIKEFQDDFQSIYISKVENDVLKGLILEALDRTHVN